MTQNLTIRNFLLTHDRDLADLCDLGRVTYQKQEALTHLTAQHGYTAARDGTGEAMFRLAILRQHFGHLAVA